MVNETMCAFMFLRIHTAYLLMLMAHSPRVVVDLSQLPLVHGGAQGVDGVKVGLERPQHLLQKRNVQLQMIKHAVY